MDRMIAPTSHQRIQTIAKDAGGFIYCVSSLGVTGVRSTITTDISAMVHLVREVADVPVAVGFGISTPEQAKKWLINPMELLRRLLKSMEKMRISMLRNMLKKW